MRLDRSESVLADAQGECLRPGPFPSPSPGARSAAFSASARPRPGQHAPEARLAPGEMVRVEALSKTFVLHLSGPAVLKALEGVSFSVHAGECLAVAGPSGSGKSSLLRCVYGNYLPSSGEILVRDGNGAVSLSGADPRAVLGLRLRSLAYASQFLRVIPRVSALEIVAEPLAARGAPLAEARAAASELLGRLHVPERLQALPPATFSGGERQRVNLARSLVWPAPVLLLDEPTASLDPANEKVVCELVTEAKRRGAAVVGIFHGREAWSRVWDSVYEMRPPGTGGAPAPRFRGREL